MVGEALQVLLLLVEPPLELLELLLLALTNGIVLVCALPALEGVTVLCKGRETVSVWAGE